MLQSLSILCLAPDGFGSFRKYLGAPVRLARMSRSIECRVPHNFHVDDVSVGFWNWVDSSLTSASLEIRNVMSSLTVIPPSVIIRIIYQHQIQIMEIELIIFEC